MITPISNFGSIGECIITDKFISNMYKKLNIANDIVAYIKSKETKDLQKTDGKKRSKMYRTSNL